MLTTPHSKNVSCYESLTQKDLDLNDTLVGPKHWKKDMRFSTWNISILCRSGFLTAAARKLARYKSNLVGLQEVRWDKESTVRAGDSNFFLWKSIGNRILCTPQNSISSNESKGC